MITGGVLLAAVVIDASFKNQRERAGATRGAVTARRAGALTAHVVGAGLPASPAPFALSLERADALARTLLAPGGTSRESGVR